MNNASAADVKRLRDRTGAGILDCKKALEQANGDLAEATSILRLKGASDVIRRAARSASNGLVTAQLTGTDSGVLVELNCETDFVAKTGLFQQAAGEIARTALGGQITSRLALLSAEVAPGRTVEELIDTAGATLKENLRLGRYAHFEGGFVASYEHRSAIALPPALGVLIQLDNADKDLAREVFHQIAAMRPLYVTREQIPPDIVAKERSMAEQMARVEGRSERVIPEIASGQLNAFFKNVVLLDQPFIRDSKKTIRQVLSGTGATVRRFARFQIGEDGDTCTFNR